MARVSRQILTSASSVYMCLQVRFITTLPHYNPKPVVAIDMEKLNCWLCIILHELCAVNGFQLLLYSQTKEYAFGLYQALHSMHTK